MSLLRTHQLLNRLLPVSVRNLGRSAAIRFIPSMRHLEMPVRLAQLRDLGFAPRVVLDIGAASGDWARMAHGIWPDARIIGFEPNEREVPGLEKTRTDVPKFEYIRGFLGPEAKTVEYADADTQTSLYAPADAAVGTAAEAPMYVLDDLLAEGRIAQPQFLKADVQGFELEVLRGAKRLLEGVEVVMLEVSYYPFMPGVPTIEDVLPFMSERGFAWYDIAGLIRRPDNDRLHQIDAIFVRRGHRLLNV